MPAEIGITSTAIESSAQRSERAKAPGASTWRVKSGWMAVWIGWASTAYGARKNVNDTWYTTVPPSTRLPITMAASRSAPTMEFWNAAHPDSFSSPLTAASGRLRRGTRRNPPRQSATAGIPTKAATPSVPPRARISFSPTDSDSPGSGPATTRNTPIATITMTVSPIGAMPVTASRRCAYSAATAMAPIAYSTICGMKK